MDTQDQARSLMMRHHKLIKNRQQSLLNRVADEVGIEPGDYRTTIQGKPTENASNYDRSGSSMS
ncbi:hypothetical protein PCC9214_00543 [Planktothrix tepida]|uniref:Glutamine synthetase inactivating factor IF7 n=2 Tax=Planktothrix TaxID=54304 RepID=A0A1J1LFR4_9CYAN|nr:MULTISPECIES: hypothetical protein [Planktothrix]CAD5919133.1 hypothetical protein PCC9214_00543 [Planktothrix tepida]CAD5984167.1 hypothetical protein NO713_05254 [Planktothrix pseudagardhii]CUR30834.1 conserved hypothetical protein [Planktothrix tepida PCC 9214]